MNFEQTLEKYAELIVKVGLNIQPGQRLMVIRAPIEAAPFIRQVAAQAYKAGARLVDVLWRDDEMILNRFKYTPRDSFDEHPTWKTDGWRTAAERGDAILSVRGEDPDLLKGQDAELVGLAQKTAWTHSRPALEITGRNGTNWTVAAAPIQGWASKVFPELSPAEATEKLWELVFKICRMDEADPVAAWREHTDELAARRAYMNAKAYVGMQYRGPGTDFRVGLPQGHIWLGGSGHTEGGIEFNANLPTEEIFTMPHKDETEGVVSASLPLSYGGTLMKDFSLRFERGRVVAASASAGEAVLRKLLETDEDTARLGEVALVPHSSPIAQTGILFYDGLIDENAASHLALGKAYAINIEGGPGMSPEAFEAAGGNNSLVHVDFMVGLDQLDVDGIRADGGVEPVMRGGDWAFEI